MSEETLASALAKFQAELPRIAKDKRADTGSYTYAFADLADVNAAVLPALGRVGLSFSSKPTVNEDGRFALLYRLRHVSGESDAGEWPLPTGVAPQALGSAISYARRYALCAVTGVAPDDDDDGKAATVAHEQNAKEDKARGKSRPRGNRTDDKPRTIEGDQAMLSRLHIRLKDYGLGENKDAALAYYAEVVGHDVDSSKSLTYAEANKVIRRLEADLRKGTDVKPPAAESGSEDPPDEYDPTTDPSWQHEEAAS